MRRLRRSAGAGSPRNPVHPDPRAVRERTRAAGTPIPYTSMGL